MERSTAVGLGAGLAGLAGLLWLLTGSGLRDQTARPRAESARAEESPAELGTVEPAAVPEESSRSTSPTLEDHTIATVRPEGPPGAPLGTILGSVVDLEDVPVPGIQVRLEETGQVTQSDAGGRFTFAHLRPDAYRLTVAGELPPGGPMPLWSMGWQRPTEVEVPEEGGEVRAVLVLAQVATVTGRVLGPDGEPARVAAVRASCQLSEAQPQAVDGSTDGEGRFRLERLWPGECMLEVWPRRTDPLATLPRPRLAFTVAPGQTLELGDIHFQGGPCAILGRVIDQDERPVGGIAIVCVGAMQTGTRADGTFLLENLQPGSYSLWVGPARPGFRRIFADEQWWHSVKPDLTDGTRTLDLGEIRVERARLFELRGHLETDPALYPLDELRLSIEGLPARSYSPAPPVPVRLDRATGTFEFWFDPQAGPRDLTLVVSRRDQDLVRLAVRAVADARVELVVPVR